jgi:replication-associated recombination protein RarA
MVLLKQIVNEIKMMIELRPPKFSETNKIYKLLMKKKKLIEENLWSTFMCMAGSPERKCLEDLKLIDCNDELLIFVHSGGMRKMMNYLRVSLKMSSEKKEKWGKEILNILQEKNLLQDFLNDEHESLDCLKKLIFSKEGESEKIIKMETIVLDDDS